MSFLLPEQVMNLQGDSSEEWAVGSVVSYFPSCLHSRRHAFTVCWGMMAESVDRKGVLALQE